MSGQVVGQLHLRGDSPHRRRRRRRIARESDVGDIVMSREPPRAVRLHFSNSQRTDLLREEVGADDRPEEDRNVSPNVVPRHAPGEQLRETEVVAVNFERMETSNYGRVDQVAVVVDVAGVRLVHRRRYADLDLGRVGGRPPNGTGEAPCNLSGEILAIQVREHRVAHPGRVVLSGTLGEHSRSVEVVGVADIQLHVLVRPRRVDGGRIEKRAPRCFSHQLVTARGDRRDRGVRHDGRRRVVRAAVEAEQTKHDSEHDNVPDDVGAQVEAGQRGKEHAGLHVTPPE